MKIPTILVTALMALSSTASAGIPISNIDPGLLTNEPKVRFNGGSSMVRLENGDFFKMQGFGDRVEFQSLSNKDWYFDNKVIYPQELDLSDIYNVEPADILTITATAFHRGGEQFYVDLVKFSERGRTVLQAIRVRPVIPEAANIALIFGVIGMLYLNRRHLNYS